MLSWEKLFRLTRFVTSQTFFIIPWCMTLKHLSREHMMKLINLMWDSRSAAWLLSTSTWKQLYLCSDLAKSQKWHMVSVCSEAQSPRQLHHSASDPGQSKMFPLPWYLKMKTKCFSKYTFSANHFAKCISPVVKRDEGGPMHLWSSSPQIMFELGMVTCSIKGLFTNLIISGYKIFCKYEAAFSSSCICSG